VYMLLQRRSHDLFVKIHNFLTYPTITLTTIAAAVVTLDEGSYPTRIAVMIMSILATVLLALLRNARPAELSQAHAMACAQYHSLLHTMESSLNLPYSMRPEAEPFMDRIRADLDRLINTQTSPPPIVIRGFEKDIGNVDGIMYGDDVIDVVFNDIKVKLMKRALETENNINMIGRVTQDIDRLIARHGG